MLIIKSLLLACTAAVVLATGSEYDALVSGARLTGRDQSDRNAQGTEVYAHPRNHPRAVASILLFSAERSEFRPREKGVLLDSQAYNNYLGEVFEFPGFRNREERQEDLELNGDRKQFRDSIAERYNSEVNNDREIAKAIERLLPRELDENQGEGENNWLLTHTTVNSDSELHQVQVEIAHIAVKLTKDEQSGRTKIEPQNAQLTINSFRVDTGFLVNHAEKLAKEIPTVRVNRFLEDLSTNGRDNRDDDNEDDRNDDEELTAWFRGTKANNCGQAPRLYPISQFRLGH